MQHRFLPVVLVISLITTCSEVDISVPSFPDIARYFNVTQGIVQLTIAYNFLGFCIGALGYGPLSESYGRRKMMIFGNGLMLLGAIGCYFAPTIELLLISRFIQGIGASTSVVLVFAMIADVYQGKKAIKLIGFMNASLAIVMTIAPIVGGFINQAIGWKGNYGCVALMSLVSWLLLLLMLPETKSELQGLSLSSIFKDYKKLFTSMQFFSASLIPSLLFAAYMCYIATSSFIYMETFGLNTFMFIVNQAIIVTTFAFVSLLSGKLTQLYGPNNIIKWGISICSLGAVLLIFMGFLEPRSPFLMTTLMCLFCIGFAICYPIIFFESLEVFPALKGTASSFNMSTRALLVFIFTGFTGYIFNSEPLMISIPILICVFLSLLLTIVLQYSKNRLIVV